MSDLPYDIERALARCFDSVRSVEASGEGQGRMAEDIAALRGLLGQLVADRAAARAELQAYELRAKLDKAMDLVVRPPIGPIDVLRGELAEHARRWDALLADALTSIDQAAKPAGGAS